MNKDIVENLREVYEYDRVSRIGCMMVLAEFVIVIAIVVILGVL